MSGSPVLFGSRNSLVLAVSVSSGTSGSFDSDGSFVLTFFVLLSGSSRYYGCSGSSGTLVIVLVLVLKAFLVFVVAVALLG